MDESIRLQTQEKYDGGHARFCCHRGQCSVDEADLLREERLRTSEQTVTEGRKMACRYSILSLLAALLLSITPLLIASL